MNFVLALQHHATDDAGDDRRWISSWSIIGCASTLSIGAC